jgi:NADH dehydrogenase
MEKKQVVTADGPVDYDFLVIAIGGAAHLPEIPGLELAYKFNDIKDVQKIIRRLLKADNETVVVAGAGATGVEVAGEIAAYTETAGKRLSIVLSSPSLLAGFPENTKSWARSYLHALGVGLKIGPMYAVSKVTDCSILLHGGETIKSSFMIWTGGTKSSPLPKQIGLTTGYRDRVAVNQFLQSIDRPEVFVVGDCALILDEQGKQLATSAQFAKQQGRLAARNINAVITREDLQKYTPSEEGFAISIGPSFAVARIGTLDLYGGVASSAKKLIKLKYLKEIAGVSTAARDYFS